MSKILSDELDALIDSAKLLGGTEAKKIFDCYTEEDSRFRTAMYESISKHRRAIEAAVLEAQGKQEPVGEVTSYHTAGMYDEFPIGTKLYAAPVVHPAPEEGSCSTHPDAPHGFDRNASHNAGRYVCECEGWKP